MQKADKVIFQNNKILNRSMAQPLFGDWTLAELKNLNIKISDDRIYRSDKVSKKKEAWLAVKGK